MRRSHQSKYSAQFVSDIAFHLYVKGERRAKNICKSFMKEIKPEVLKVLDRSLGLCGNQESNRKGPLLTRKSPSLPAKEALLQQVRPVEGMIAAGALNWIRGSFAFIVGPGSQV